jgi:hypothetical protein
MSRKHLFARFSLDSSTDFRVPISPRGYLFSTPSNHVQEGGQLRTPPVRHQWVVSEKHLGFRYGGT